MSDPMGGISSPPIKGAKFSTNTIIIQNEVETNQLMDQDTSRNDYLKNLTYKPLDKGPFSIYIESNKQNVNLDKLHPMQLGKILADGNVENIKTISSRGRNRINIDFKLYSAANEFLKNPLLNQHNLSAYIPRHKITCQAVIRGVSTFYPESEILKDIQSSIKVLAVRRLNRRSTIINEIGKNEITYIPTGTIVLTFYGSIPPSHVSIYYCKFETSIYIQPVIQCFNCLRFGHTQKLCKSTVRCANCLEPHDTSTCNETPKCLYCKANHSATYFQCPERERQKTIKTNMAAKNLSAFEADKLTPKTYKTTTSNIRYGPNLLSENFPPLHHTAENSDSEDLNSPSSLVFIPQQSARYAESMRSERKRTVSQRRKILPLRNLNSQSFYNNSGTPDVTPSEPIYNHKSRIQSQIHTLQMEILDDLTIPDNKKKTWHSLLTTISHFFKSIPRPLINYNSPTEEYNDIEH